MGEGTGKAPSCRIGKTRKSPQTLRTAPLAGFIPLGDQLLSSPGKVQAVFAAHLVNGAAGGKMEFPGVRIYNVGNGIF